jgi:cobalt-zinc-cadmium efflux system outer membrane protein
MRAVIRVLITLVVVARVMTVDARAASPTPSPLAPVPAPVAPYAFDGFSLAAALDAAVINSPDVAAARAKVDENRGALLAARGGFGPSLVSNYTQTPQGNPPGPTIASRIGTLGLQATVGDLFSLSPNVRAAAATLSGAQADADVATRDERIKTIGLYYDALKARALARARADALTLAERQRDAARIRFAAGDAPRLDVVRADVAVAKATADSESARVSDANATDALRIETGLGASALAATTASELATIDATLSDPEHATTLALQRRAEILSADDGVRAAVASARAVGASAFPTLTVGAGYAIGTDSDVPINGPTVNVALSIALSGTVSGKIAAERAKIDEARAKLVGATRAVRLEVSAAARSLGAAERIAAATSHARVEAQAELAASELGYRSGASSSLDLASARTTYAQTVVDELSALYDVAKARATLAAQVGR